MAANDRLNRVTVITEVEAVTPSDSADLPGALSRGLYVGTSGDVALIPAEGESPVTLVGLAAGLWHPISARRILATGTTATGILIGR